MTSTGAGPGAARTTRGAESYMGFVGVSTDPPSTPGASDRASQAPANSAATHNARRPIIQSNVFNRNKLPFLEAVNK